MTMKYQILQLDDQNPNVIRDGRRFATWDHLNKTCGFSKLCYKKVYEGDIEPEHKLDALDQLYYIFNNHHPDDFNGHSLSISDVVVLDGTMYYCDSFGWVNVNTEERV